MSIDIIMPQMGESVVEGTILKWLVKEGDRVEKDQPIVEISTDKIDTEAPSPVRGVIKNILYPEGTTLPVLTVIARIEQVEVHETTSPADDKPVAVEKADKIETAKAAVNTEEAEAERRYSPLVRKLAKEYSIALEGIKGTGEGGRVTKKDVMEYVASKQTVFTPHPEETKERLMEKETLIRISPKRKITADRMVQSKRTAAHVTTVFEVDMTKVEKYRTLNKDSLKRENIHLTYIPFVILAAARSLKERPLLNASWTDEGIVQKNYVNIGIAVSVEDGLIVPVINDADKKDLLQIARQVQDIAQRSRTKKIKPEEVQGGTFTITNHGLNGSLFATPVILLPQTAILGVGAVVKRPVVIDDAIAIRSMAYLSLSFDHRVIDGADADAFLRKVKGILEGWEVSPYEAKSHSPATGYGGVW
ncbi:MAG TPA: dihydrolipoamide acetyltransferase family protein [Candidatus Brocadiaceae bacterium]|nr:dihydrolipoamide acetyltransferase family protein [Candidatus Brocadiaceae bacterium]